MFSWPGPFFREDAVTVIEEIERLRELKGGHFCNERRLLRSHGGLGLSSKRSLPAKTISQKALPSGPASRAVIAGSVQSFQGSYIVAGLLFKKLAQDISRPDRRRIARTDRFRPQAERFLKSKAITEFRVNFSRK